MMFFEIRDCSWDLDLALCVQSFGDVSVRFEDLAFLVTVVNLRLGKDLFAVVEALCCY